MPPILVPQLEPLRTSPGLRQWLRRKGQTYFVFVDETFFEFFGLVAKTGYYCHAAVGLPMDDYDAVREKIAPIFQDYRALTSALATEFKHRDFRQIAYRDRHRLALRLRNVLWDHGGFVLGRYVPVRPFVLERVRASLLDVAEQIPADYEELHRSTATKLRRALAGPGQADLVRRLILLPMVGVANMLASLECPFIVVYDPREKEEDGAVRAYVQDVIGQMAHLKTVPDADLRGDLNDYFLEFEHSRSSEDEIGLQLADLMAGEVRSFIHANDGLLSFGASPKLVTSTSEEAVNTVTFMSGRLWKTGVLHRMPPDLRDCFFRPDRPGRTVLPLFRNLLAAGILTCYSTWGQPRDLMPFEGLIWDQAD